LPIRGPYLRERVKRRQRLRRFEIVAVVGVIAVLVIVVVYFAMNSQRSKDVNIGRPVSQGDYSSLYQASKAPYGASSSTYLTSVQSIGGPLYSKDGKPILISATGEYCSPCALQRWPLIIALLRFGNFTNLEYMASSVSEGDYATFAFAQSSYQSRYLVFQPYEVYSRSANPFQTLPTNYSLAQAQYGKSTIPFLDFANKYVILGGLLSDPSLLGTKNWTQIVVSIQIGDTLGTRIKQAANVFTALICKTTSGNPASVCSQSSIMGLTVGLTSYSGSSAGVSLDFLLPRVLTNAEIQPTTYVSRAPRWVLAQ